MPIMQSRIKKIRTKTKKVKKPKAHTQGYWKRQLDPIMSKLVREKGFCERCGRQNGVMNWSHVIGRSNLTLRWDIMNALCLCYRCHLYFWHQEPIQAAIWFHSKFPERLVYLNKAKDILLNRTEEDYKELKEWIKNKDLNRLHIDL